MNENHRSYEESSTYFKFETTLEYIIFVEKVNFIVLFFVLIFTYKNLTFTPSHVIINYNGWYYSLPIQHQYIYASQEHGNKIDTHQQINKEVIATCNSKC